MIFLNDGEDGAEDVEPGNPTSFNFFNFSIFSEVDSFIFCISEADLAYDTEAGRGNEAVGVNWPEGFGGLRTCCLAFPSAPTTDTPFYFFLFLNNTYGRCRLLWEREMRPNRGCVCPCPCCWLAHYRRRKTISIS